MELQKSSFQLAEERKKEKKKILTPSWESEYNCARTREVFLTCIKLVCIYPL